MPYFRAKKRCQYGGNVYDKNAVEQFSTPVSAQSWEAMDEEGEELLIYPENTGPDEGKGKDSGKSEADEVLISGEEFAELQGLYDAALVDLGTQRTELKELKVKLEEGEGDLAALLVENDKLAKAAEGATALQGKISALKQKVKDNENKSVLEEAIEAL